MAARHVKPAMPRGGVGAAGRGDHEMDENLKDSDFPKQDLPVTGARHLCAARSYELSLRFRAWP
jgi:hypothetical protein